MSLMKIHVNGEPQIDYDRSKSISNKQQEYLGKMDDGMDAGINLNGEEFKQPDLLQRAKFVAGYLSQALFDDNEQMIAASSAWLAIRLPDLKQVKIVRDGDQISIDLIFDESRQNHVKVDLQMPTKGKALH